MHLRRTIGTLAAAASLILGLAAVPAYAASAGPAKAAAASTAQAGSYSASLMGPDTHGSPAVDRIPLIQFRECSNQTTTWVDIDILTGSGLQDWCFGYDGTYVFYAPQNDLFAFCSGNNHGTFRYSQNGKLHDVDFKSGEVFTFSSGVLLQAIQINGWSGTYRCKS